MNDNFIQLGQLIDRLLRNYNLQRRVKESSVITIWHSAVGKKISRVTEPIKVQDGKLFVRVSTPSWRNELVLMKPHIKEKINTQIGEDILSDIIFM